MKRLVSGMLLLLLLTSILTLAFKIQPVKADAQTIYINADGSITPVSAPVSTFDNITYTVTGDINFHDYDGMVVERNDTVIDGNEHSIQGAFNIGDTSVGISLLDTSNVTVENFNIQGVSMGISLTNSSNDKINGNTVLQSGGGILLTNSSNNIVTGNSVSENFPWAIILPLIYPLYMGIGIDLGSSSNNTISENYIAENWWGIVLDSSSYNSVYHNAFFENNGQASVELQSVGNVWDNGYPSGGNYWSDYNGTDLYSGPFQNVTGSDGIGDTPYFIEPILDTYDIDYYPLMRPMLVLVTEITTSNRWVYQGQPININVTVSNIGSSPENVWVTLYYNISASKSIDSYPIDLDAGQSFTFQFKWNTAGTPCLNYTLAAMTTISATISAGSNTFTDGNVTIRLMGDVNGDGVVDLRDIALVARAFGSTPSSPNWNPAADINGDGVVNMKDIALVARHFGQHYP